VEQEINYMGARVLLADVGLRHSIDNMHVKKNVCEATCGTLLQEKSKGKDHKNAMEDFKELGIRPELYADDEVTKGKKKAKSHTQAQNKSRCKTEVFLWSLLTYLVLH
jgi:hypothetical protein